MPSFGAIKSVCHDRHKTGPEFILIPYDVDKNHISKFTDVKPLASFAYKGCFDLGKFYC